MLPLPGMDKQCPRDRNRDVVEEEEEGRGGGEEERRKRGTREEERERAGSRRWSKTRDRQMPVRVATAAWEGKGRGRERREGNARQNGTQEKPGAPRPPSRVWSGLVWSAWSACPFREKPTHSPSLRKRTKALKH
ncbi:hypothetical protein BO70DRAFT_6362 [Aspergillus heteromorphus CBS 117.55]|uniref:Uncharacterized protein n=1 Tax=Aspergillus heteromorphus CBS 117.55 TaxID=1448321 RepID=A0A317X0R6_9EURO|nr:uncharacterized protein BO70DRAFT_6362 [Aspergillus heteromorphus CBS 117.55]PWY92244.1 hypothetical protein BO70DRAFT_6362 [Aspergillus heteromorphus CBS 117.55]